MQCGGAPLPAGWAAPGKVLLFGEFHGTRELPAAFGEVVCHAARTGPVLVGVEFPRTENGRVSALLATRSAAERDAILRSSPFWTSSLQYGATSEAMAALLARLADLHAAGLPVEVFAFDEARYDHPERRDEQMAANIVAAVGGRGDARALILTGNYHARTEPGAPWDPSMRFMGSFLKGAGLDVLGLDFAGEGTAWACMASDEDGAGLPAKQVCGPTRVRGRSNPRETLTVLDAPTPEGFAGVWGAASLTASPPAVAVREK